jgi:hypothetical protein
LRNLVKGGYLIEDLTGAGYDSGLAQGLIGGGSRVVTTAAPVSRASVRVTTRRLR